MALDYFYDSQIRRYLLQFVRIFNGFQYASGNDSSGRPVFRTVPATLASMDRQVNNILQNNSENVVLSTPQISCSISSIRKAPERIQDPNYVRTKNVFERALDPKTNRYLEDTLGKTYTVESYMPVPYDLVMHMDLWTSNEFQKHQLLEQILVLFNPSIDLQTGNNPIDWSALTIVELEEVTWSSRSYPAGTTDQIDVTTLSFRMPIWLNAPSKVRRQNIIQQIIVDISLLEDRNNDIDENSHWSETELISRIIVTPGEHCVSVSGNEITLLNGNGGNKVDDLEYPMSWPDLLNRYGKFRPNISQIRLKPVGIDIEDTSHDIVGVLAFNPNDPSKIFWTLDMHTLQPNTIPSITRVVDPTVSYPGNGLDPLAIGQRYLILNDIPEGVAWGGLTAWNNDMPKQQDIIEYTVEGWTVPFRAIGHTSQEYVLNSTSGKQLHWNGSVWHLTIEGQYYPGHWRIFL